MTKAYRLALLASIAMLAACNQANAGQDANTAAVTNAAATTPDTSLPPAIAKAASDPAYRREKAGVDFDLGEFPWERVNPNGGSLSIGHPFAATGARILSQAAKELAGFPKGSRAIVSVCADGGQGTVALLEAV